jgi:hypothetical protein
VAKNQPPNCTWICECPLDVHVAHLRRWPFWKFVGFKCQFVWSMVSIEWWKAMELIVGFIISLKVRVGFTINCLMLVMDLALGTFIGKLVTI